MSAIAMGAAAWNTPLVADPQRERARVLAVRLVITTYLLLVLEGALRKWALEPLHKALFFIRDPFVLGSIYLCWRHRLIEHSPLAAIALATAMAFVFLGGYHVIAWNLNPMVVVFGWRNYFLYLFFALVMGAVLRRRDVETLIRVSLIMALPMAVLAYIQWKSPTDAWINRQIGGGDVFTVAQGVVRTSGTFTFTAGFVCFVGATLATLGAAAFTRAIPRWLVLAGAAAGATCLATSGARMAFMHAGVTGAMAIACEAFRPLAQQRLVVLIGAPVMTIVLAAGLAFFYPQALELMAERTHTASSHEDSGQRLLSNFTSGFVVGEDAGLLGRGLGLGSSGGSSVATGDRSFTLAEEEFPRVVLEGGLIFGLGYMLLRYALCAWLFWQGVRCVRERRDAVPLMLFSFTGPLLMVGQMTMQGTINGYGWIFTGLTLAAIATSRESESSHG
jgi:hypothetical protein